MSKKVVWVLGCCVAVGGLVACGGGDSASTPPSDPSTGTGTGTSSDESTASKDTSSENAGAAKANAAADPAQQPAQQANPAEPTPTPATSAIPEIGKVPGCEQAKDIGSISGDVGVYADESFSGDGSKWIKVDVDDTPDPSFGGLMRARFNLEKKAEGEIAYAVYEKCGSAPKLVSASAGEQTMTWDDDFLSDDSKTLYVEIRAEKAWTLKVTGGNGL